MHLKCVAVSPDQRTEVNALKLSLHLNIAMCWLKITDAENHLEQAIRSCDEALSLDADSVKALFRRATAREAKGLYDEAMPSLHLPPSPAISLHLPSSPYVHAGTTRRSST